MAFAPRAALLVSAFMLAGSSQAAPPSSTTYHIRHTLKVKDIPEGAKKVRIWFWVPDDDEFQKVLDFKTVSASGETRFTRDAMHGHRYLYTELAKPGSDPVAVNTEFTIRRQAVKIDLDPEKAGALTDTHRQLLAEYLRKDTPNMVVDDTIAKLADKICGEEKNIVKQVKALYDYLVDNTNHYSKPGAPKNSGLGSSTYCLDSKGGGCTDQHAAFIALARARGIPTRLHFGSRLQPQNAGKAHDPGYRCWVTYFVPNYGWVPLDISAGNTNNKERERFWCGLDDRRIRFSEGRDLDLTPRQEGPRLNLLIIAYVEIDGKPHKGFERVVQFEEVKEAEKSTQK